MFDSGSRYLRLATLGLLYFVQGSPYGFQTSCLPIILRETGLSFTKLGVMKLLFLPWVCKPLYAPIIEQTKSKKWWLTVSMLSLGLTCLFAGILTNESDIMAISITMFILNLLSAGHDVATDSLAVMVLPPEDLGAGNTVQVVAYKAGSVFASGLLLWVQQIFGWAGMFLGFSSIYFLGIILIRRLNLVERSANFKKQKDTPIQEKDKFQDKNLINVTRAVLTVKGTVHVIAFVMFYKLCERAEQTFSLFMVDKKVPRTEMALWSTIMRCFSLLGSTYGGYLLSASSSGGQKLRRMILKYSTLRALPIFGQLCILYSWGVESVENPEETFSHWNRDTLLMYAGFSCTSITLFCAGVITTGAFTVMMKLSQSAPDGLQGTHFTTLATFEVLGKLLFASVAGLLIDTLGLHFMLISFVILATLCIPQIIFFMPEYLWKEINDK